jgi:hypothetical protein
MNQDSAIRKGRNTEMGLQLAVGSAAFSLKRSFSAVVSLFRCSLETHPECFRDSDTQGCLMLHFANNRDEKRANTLKATLPTAAVRIMSHCSCKKKLDSKNEVKKKGLPATPYSTLPWPAIRKEEFTVSEIYT